MQCADGTYYCGVTNDLDKRLAAHNAGKGARYTRSRLPVEVVVFSGNCLTKSAALKAELQVKKLPRNRKPEFVRSLSLCTQAN